jgi:hypothetical protein
LKRWLTLVLGVGLAAAALHALLSRPRDGKLPTHDDIDGASKARMERVLRDAERRP